MRPIKFTSTTHFKKEKKNTTHFKKEKKIKTVNISMKLDSLVTTTYPIKSH